MRTWRTWLGGAAIVVVAVVVVFLLQVGYAMWIFSYTFPEPNQMDTRGQFGDLFGAVTAFFTGLAFAGVIYTIILQRRELELSTRLSVIAALVNAYASHLATTEQGKFRGYLWQANEKIISRAKEEGDEPLGDEDARNIDIKMVDCYFDMHPDDRADDSDSNSPKFGDPVFRRSFKEWLRARQQRNHFLEILEDMYEGDRQDASVGAKSDKRTQTPSVPNV